MTVLDGVEMCDGVRVYDGVQVCDGVDVYAGQGCARLTRRDARKAGAGALTEEVQVSGPSGVRCGVGLKISQLPTGNIVSV